MQLSGKELTQPVQGPGFNPYHHNQINTWWKTKKKKKIKSWLSGCTLLEHTPVTLALRQLRQRVDWLSEASLAAWQSPASQQQEDKTKTKQALPGKGPRRVFQQRLACRASVRGSVSTHDRSVYKPRL